MAFRIWGELSVLLQTICSELGGKSGDLSDDLSRAEAGTATHWEAKMEAEWAGKED